MKTWIIVAVVGIGALTLGYGIGSRSQPGDAPSGSNATSASGDRMAPVRRAPLPAPASPQPALRPPEGRNSGSAVPDSGRSGVSPSTEAREVTQRFDLDADVPPEECAAALDETRERVKLLETLRRDKEGEPIPARESSSMAPRFRQDGLLATFNQGFAITEIPGQVESIDCTEYPCLVFGRIQGDEELVAALEDSSAFATYDNDIGVMLTWASGDARYGSATQGEGRNKPAEISLFAFAFYSYEDKDSLGESIDKRIRSRTADYWNASHRTPD